MFVLIGSVMFLRFLDSFFDRYSLSFFSPIEIKLQQPIVVVERKTKIEYIREFAESLPIPKTPLEKYICEKFGKECQIALAVALAESGMREEAINVNTNSTIDIGIFQINSVHWKKNGCSPKELFDSYKNVDCAYKIYSASGWSAWSAVNNGSFAKFVK